MALNAVDQHKGAIVRPARNNSNAYNSGDPLGNATGGGGGSAPSAVSDLAVASIGSSSASLSWTLPADTDNVEVYQRDVTAAGSFALIATLGAVSSYNVSGLTSENQYEWKVVATNAEGSSADSNTVSGTTTAVSNAPDAVSDLSLDSVSSNGASLSWSLPADTDNIEIYQRDVTASGAFSLIDTIGALSSYSVSGLVSENQYEWKIVATNSFGSSPDSNTVSGTTTAEIGEAYQLQAGEYPPARMPLRWVNPTGDETSRSAFLWSHSDFDYVRRVTVAGGSPPYYFYLNTPVAGVTFERKAPAWNPYLFLWADLIIDHTQFQSGTKALDLRCVDQAGTTLSLALTVTVDNSKFVVADSVNGATVAVGSLADPYSDFIDIMTTDENDSTHAGKTIVLRNGSYAIDNFDSSSSALQFNNNKPSGWIPYPGESFSINSSANMLVGGTLGGPYVDYYFGECTINGSDATAANVKVFSLLASHERVTFDHISFISPNAGTSGTDNEACIYCSNTSFDAHQSISVVDPYYEDLPVSGNGFAMVDFYGTTSAAFVGGTIRNTNTNNGIWLKARNDQCMFAGLDGYDTTGQEVNKFLYPNQGDAGDTTPVGIIQFVGCKVQRPTDGIFSDTTVLLGDSNQAWGEVFLDRMTVVGAVRDGGGDASTLGDATLESCIVINNVTPKIASFATSTNNLTDSRSNLSTYLDANGDVQAGLAQHGQAGANFVAPEAL